MAARGDALLSPTVTRRLISEYVSRPPEAVQAAGLEALTNREREVVALVARGLSNDEIAAHMVMCGCDHLRRAQHLGGGPGAIRRALRP